MATTAKGADTSSVRYNVATMPLRPRHYWIVGVASLGQLIGTAVATIAGVIIPLLNIILHPELSGFMQGIIGAADLLGICIGSVLSQRPLRLSVFLPVLPFADIRGLHSLHIYR